MSMKIQCAHTEIADIDLVTPNPRNPNKHPDAQIKLLAKIMAHQGWRSPVVISNRSGFITKGHGRLAAAKLNGWTQIPVDRQDYANEADEYADMVADNKIAELAETDLAMVNEMALSLPEDFDLELLGIPDFDPVEVEVLEPQCDEDEVGEAPEEPKTKRGDIYRLGRHRLMCGDSTSITDIDELMAGEKAQLVVTDPPYNYDMAAGGGGAWGAAASKVAKSIEHISKFEPEEFLNVLPSLFADRFCAYIFCNTALVRNYLNWAFENDYSSNVLAWHKTNFIPSNGGHHFPDTEYCIYIASRPIWNGGLSADHYRKYWIVDREISKDHPTVKPQEIIKKCIELNSETGGLVADLFGGSGSTLIACEKTGRTNFSMELDPKYCDVIVSRWEKYTGKKAELING